METPDSVSKTPSTGSRPTLVKRVLGQDGGYAAILFAAVILIYLFGWREMRFFLVPSGSMEPTLLRSDHLITLKQPEYRRGDIVVIYEAESSEYVVKRIVGLSGDAITVREGALFIDGQYVSEPYISQPMEYVIDAPVTVPENEVFVLGDNRNNSDDSHVNGKSQAVSTIIGRVRFIYYPYSRWGRVRSYPLMVSTAS
jgi:signal peptidase I